MKIIDRYFHAYVNAKHKYNDMRRLYKEDGTLLTTQEDIENEILGLYGNLMDKENDNIKGINIDAMKEGP